ADIGWMGFRNDTGKILIIQETVSIGSASRPGKPQKIFANETVRDTSSGGGQRSFTIYESGKPDKTLYSGVFSAPAANENVLYAMKFNSKGDLVIDAIRSPIVTSTKTKSTPKHKD